MKYMRMRGQPLLYGRALVRGVRAGNQVQFRTQYLKHCQGGDIYNPTPGFSMQQSGTKTKYVFRNLLLIIAIMMFCGDRMLSAILNR